MRYSFSESGNVHPETKSRKVDSFENYESVETGNWIASYSRHETMNGESTSKSVSKVFKTEKEAKDFLDGLLK